MLATNQKPLGKTKDKSCIDSLKNDGIVLNNPKMITDKLGEHFLLLGKMQAGQIQKCDPPNKYHNFPANAQSIFLSPTGE